LIDVSLHIPLQTVEDNLRGEVDSQTAETRVDEEIADRDEDDQSEGIQVGQDIIGKAVGLHGGSLGSQVVVKLVVGEP